MNIIKGVMFNWLHRDISNVLGFSRETLTAVNTNIEGIEWSRQECVSNYRPLEHPRASSIDDVECFFSMMHDTIGQTLLLKKWNLVCTRQWVSFPIKLTLTSLFSITPLPIHDTMKVLNIILMCPIYFLWNWLPDTRKKVYYTETHKVMQ